MNHRTAEEQQAAQKYLLDELSAEQRTEFEEHLFDCHICAEQVREDFTVVENLKEVLREQKVANAAPVSHPRVWNPLDWLRPSSLVPTFAAIALAGIVIYQNVVPGRMVPAAQILPAASIIAPVTRGGGGIESVTVDRTKPDFLLSFMVDAAKPDTFTCQFQTEAGAPVVKISTAPQQTASFTLNILLAAKLFPVGRYRMLLNPVSEPQNSTTYPFAIEDNK